MAALQAFEEPAGLGQVVAQKDVVPAVVGPLHQARVAGIDAQPRQGVGIQLHPPAPVDLLDHHVGHDVQGRLRRVGGAGAGVELFDEGGDLRQFPLAELGAAPQRGEVLRREQVQVRLNEIDGLLAPRGLGVELLQLEAQGFGQSAGRHAGRVEVLQVTQHLGDLGLGNFESALEAAGDLRHAGGHHAAVVDGVDDDRGDEVFERRQGGQVELPTQMVLKGVAGVGALKQVALIGGGGRRGRGGVHVLPTGVDGQVLGNDVAALQIQFRRLRGGFGPLRFGFLLAGLLRAGFRCGFVALQHGVGLQRLLNLQLQFLGGQLQHANRLGELRRDDLLLPKAQRQRLLHGGKPIKAGSSRRDTRRAPCRGRVWPRRCLRRSDGPR